jgi:hypothetical protein
MSCYKLETPLLSRGDRVRSGVLDPRPLTRIPQTRPSAILVALFLLAGPACTQEPPQELEPAPPTASQRPLPEGIQLNSVSAYTGATQLRFSDTGGGTSGARDGLIVSGATADVAWHSGRQTLFSVGYHAGYTYNQRYSSLNGFDHTVAIDLRTDPARRTVFSLAATGQSGVFSDVLFAASHSLSVAQQASSAQQLASGLLENGASAGLNSPLDLALSGSRRRSGAVYASVTHSYSRRLTSSVRVGISRELRSNSGQSEFASLYPNVTVGVADFGLTYSVSSRTRIIGSGNYSRSYTRLHRSEWESAGAGIERLIGRRSFGYVQGGYARMGGVGSAGFGRNSYTISGALGTNKGYHTLAATARRGVSDMYGLGADNTIGFEGAWAWAPHAISWTLGSSVGYERIRGVGVGMVQAWVYQTNAVRRLSDHFEIVFAGVYITNSGRGAIGLASPSLRVSCLWSPRMERTH